MVNGKVKPDCKHHASTSFILAEIVICYCNTVGACIAWYADQAVDWTAEESELSSQQGIFVFFTMSMPVLESLQPPISWIQKKILM